MIGHQQFHIQSLAVIVHNDQVLGSGRPDYSGRERVLREMKLGQSARIVGRIVREVAIHGVRLNGFAKLIKPVFEGGNTVGPLAVRSGSQDVQQEPKTGGERDGRES